VEQDSGRLRKPREVGCGHAAMVLDLDRFTGVALHELLDEG
jgi:hypothetical protein